MDPVDNRQSRRASAASGLARWSEWAGGEGRQGSDTWAAWQHGRCMARARTSPPKRARRGLEAVLGFARRAAQSEMPSPTLFPSQISHHIWKASLPWPQRSHEAGRGRALEAFRLHHQSFREIGSIASTVVGHWHSPLSRIHRIHLRQPLPVRCISSRGAPPCCER